MESSLSLIAFFWAQNSVLWYFCFLDENPLTDIISIAMKLKDAQVKNFTLLWMLIRKSDEKSPLFIKNTNSQKNVQERMLKLQLLGVSNKESL